MTGQQHAANESQYLQKHGACPCEGQAFFVGAPCLCMCGRGGEFAGGYW